MSTILPGRADSVRLIWDVQNLWSTGTYPTLDVYRQLRPVLGMLHLKGGCSSDPGGPLTWASSLEEASWPVADIVRAAVRDGVSPVICLNPSHGTYVEQYPVDVERDIAFVRRQIAEID